MRILQMKHALEVAKAGSLGKAAESLLVAAPNISRSRKELEEDLGIRIFDRTKDGMKLTPEGEEFIGFAKGILNQIDEVENYYKTSSPKKQKFSISVPRASYIAEAFTEFSKSLSKDATEVFYQETNSQRVIHNILNHDYKLGILRYAKNYDKYFKALLEEKGFAANNVSLGVGSFSMECLEEDGILKPFTRDSFSIAIKATYGRTKDGKEIEIFKDPKGFSQKKSLKGLCVPYYNDKGELEVIQGCNEFSRQELIKGGVKSEFVTYYRNNDYKENEEIKIERPTFADIRKRIDENLEKEGF